jgi:hypothetical protein
MIIAAEMTTRPRSRANQEGGDRMEGTPARRTAVDAVL